jgi:hypothetical protein
MDFDLHFGAMLASFSMFFALLFRASILHGFEVFLLISVVLHPIGETLKNTCFHVALA